MARLEAVATLLRALADDTRLRILHLLWRSEPVALGVGTLVSVLRKPQPTVSRHLAYLRREGLVQSTSAGRARRYALAARQSVEQRVLLGALEELVPASPVAMHDLERLEAHKIALTGQKSDATQTLHEQPRPQASAAEDAMMTLVLGALSHATRRRLLDEIGQRAGASLGEIVDGFETSRAAIGKHLAVLERAGLVASMYEGGRRRLYLNRVPVQLVYDRWMTRLAAPLSEHAAAIKTAVEQVSK